MSKPTELQLKHFVAIFITIVLSLNANAHHTDDHFEDTTSHKIIYQLNKADDAYIGHILFSAGEMLRKYGNDIEIVIAAFGPGLNILGKHPVRPINPLHQQRISSLASYGVQLHACGNTMKALHWEKKDLIKQAIVVPIGVEDIMLLQEKGYSYFSW